jgi:hypothetical protein
MVTAMETPNLSCYQIFHGTLPLSQEPTSDPYPEPDEAIPFPYPSIYD